MVLVKNKYLYLLAIIYVVLIGGLCYLGLFNYEQLLVTWVLIGYILIGGLFIIGLLAKGNDNNPTKQLNYHNLDLARYVISIIIIITHLRPFLGYNQVLDVLFNNLLSRICVPFFLVTTGYFVAKKELVTAGYINGFIRGLIPNYLLWSAIYIPVSAIAFIQYNSYGVQFFNGMVLGWNGFFLLVPIAIAVGLLYTGVYYHLWYFPALIFSLLVLKVYKSRFSVVSLLVITGGLLLLGASETYYGVFAEVTKNGLNYYFDLFFTTRNFIFFGLFYVTLGYYLGNKLNINIRYNFIKLICFSILLVGEVIALQQITRLNSNILLMAIPVVYYLFCWVLYTKPVIKKPLKYPLRDLYRYYYLVHPLIIFLVLRLGVMGLGLKLLLVLGFTHLLSVLLLMMRKKYPKWWL